MTPKLTKANNELLYFNADGKTYFYETVQGYSFQATTKCDSAVDMFTYKLKDKWYVNDNEGHYTCLIKDERTRRRALERACNVIKKNDRARVDKAFQNASEQAENRLKGRIEKASQNSVWRNHNENN